jgi:Flp pilus assembly protein TadG
MLLSSLLLGIVTFGILLSKRQVLTQAAAEGARAAVPYQYTVSNTSAVTAAAQAQVNKSLLGVDRSCGDGSTVCSFVVYSCSGTASPPTAPTGSGDCLQVSIVVDVKGSNPLAPMVSPISPFLPSTMSSKFTATLANPT